MVVGIIAALILVWTGLLVTYIHRMKNEEKAHSDEPVSYTHLDVYKRQVLTRSLPEVSI